jgi:hypothetical protein
MLANFLCVWVYGSAICNGHMIRTLASTNNAGEIATNAVEINKAALRVCRLQQE